MHLRMWVLSNRYEVFIRRIFIRDDDVRVVLASSLVLLCIMFVEWTNIYLQSYSRRRNYEARSLTGAVHLSMNDLSVLRPAHDKNIASSIGTSKTWPIDYFGLWQGSLACGGQAFITKSPLIPWLRLFISEWSKFRQALEYVNSKMKWFFFMPIH